MRGVYIHIPFCKSICSYCDFCKLLYNEEFINNYLKALAYEIDDYYEGDTVDTIYIGGGTPSSLKNEDLRKLLTMVKTFKLADSYEYTFECNLNDINDTLLKTLKEFNVNRLSIGIESFDQDKLKIMEREAAFKDTLSKIKLCHFYGFNNINVDFMYSIEGETFERFKKDIKLFLKLPITHISTYSLIIEEHTKAKINNISNVSEELESKMYYYLIKLLKKHHFNHYEVSNFSKKGFESKHNLKYWLSENYYGFGLGASGFIGDVRYDNTHNIFDYLNHQFRKENTILTKKQLMDDYLMLGFRLTKGININDFNSKFNTDIYLEYPIKMLLKNQDLVLKKGYLSINPKRIYVMNEILLKMI